MEKINVFSEKYKDADLRDVPEEVKEELREEIYGYMWQRYEIMTAFTAFDELTPAENAYIEKVMASFQ